MKKLLILLLAVFPCVSGVVHEQSLSPCYKADVIFIMDISGSMSDYRADYNLWMQDIVDNLPLSDNVMVGLMYFSNDICAPCMLTQDKYLLKLSVDDERSCGGVGSDLYPALIRAHDYFEANTVLREESVPRILIIVTDGDIENHEECIVYRQSKMADVLCVCINPGAPPQCGSRSENTLKGLVGEKGFVIQGGLLNVYDEIFKDFEPCM